MAPAKLNAAIVRATSECAVVIDQAWAKCRVLRKSSTECVRWQCRHCDEAIERADAGRDAAIEKARAAIPAACVAAVDQANSGCDVAVEQAIARARAVIGRATAERATVRAEVASAESELDALVNAPVSGGRDPFEGLPDELIVMIMVMMPFEVLWGGVCEGVCQRWAMLVESAPVKRHKRDGRWAAYEGVKRG